MELERKPQNRSLGLLQGFSCCAEHIAEMHWAAPHLGPSLCLENEFVFSFDALLLACMYIAMT